MPGKGQAELSEHVVSNPAELATLGDLSKHCKEIHVIARSTLLQASLRRHRAWLRLGWIDENELPEPQALPRELLTANRTNDLIAHVASALDYIGYGGRRLFEQRLGEFARTTAPAALSLIHI